MRTMQCHLYCASGVDRYLSPLKAFDDAFNDIRTHHLAMVAGMHAGFESMLSRSIPNTGAGIRQACPGPVLCGPCRRYALLAAVRGSVRVFDSGDPIHFSAIVRRGVAEAYSGPRHAHGQTGKST